MRNVFLRKVLLISAISVAIISCTEEDDAVNVSGNKIPAGQATVDMINEISNDELVFVEGGSFLMGAQDKSPNLPNYDSQATTSEGPVHQVAVTSFYIMKNEVTQALWRHVMYNISPDSIDEAEYQLPITEVSYEEIVKEFIPRLNKTTGIAYRLPTEAEWEYAARGGQKDEYTRSMGQVGEYFKFAGSNDASQVVSFKLSNVAQIGLKATNALGIYDMSGNVWEWCNDWYTEEYSANNAIDPQGASSGEKRVVRGGGWDLINDADCRVSYKSAVVPDHKCNHIGFRLVVSAE